MDETRADQHAAQQSPATDRNGSSPPSADSHEITEAETPDSNSKAVGAEPVAAKQPSRIKKTWTKFGLDVPTLVLMFKGSLPPTIAIAMYQAPVVSRHYGTQGYLIAVAAIFGFCIMPRAKFLQTMVLNILAICVASAINLLALYCSTQARMHTTPTGASPVGYNASASVVCAIWLIFFVYVINVMRAVRPQLQFPAILASIFCIVSMSYGAELITMAEAISFELSLLEAFLTGFGLATAVSLLVFPISSRKVLMKEMTGYLNLLNGLLKLETAFISELATLDLEELRRQKRGQNVNPHADMKKLPRAVRGGKIPLTSTPASHKLRETLATMFSLHGRIGGDITPAKREFAYGKVLPHDFSELWKLFRMIFVPVMGLTTLMSVIERHAENNGWDKGDEFLSEDQIRERKITTENMQFVLKQMQIPFARMTQMLGDGFQHVLLTLEFVKPPKTKQQDEESPPDEQAPGTAGFAEAFKKKVDGFYGSKEEKLREWFDRQGIELPPNFFAPEFRPDPAQVPQGTERERRQRQIFFLLYLEHLLWRVSCAVLDLIMYVEKRKADGAFKRSRFIFPGAKTMYKWIQAAISKEGVAEQDAFTGEMDSGGARLLHLGQAFLMHKDPEHLPARNAVEKFGEHLRAIPRFFRSDASAFGFRVVAATMTIAVINYLSATQIWFLDQRLLWAEIMVAISMNRTAGQSTFNFVLRVLGTVIAMVASYIIWYIVDGHTAGVIVFLWLWIFCNFYIVLKFSKFLIVGILGLVTAVIIIGYELQVRAIGVQISEADGQPAYPIYVLAPYRLATVAGGLFVAFIWTIFPFPISEGTEMRKDLAACLYILSNFYSIVHETVLARIKGIGGDDEQEGTHAYNLEKARARVFQKLVVLLDSLRTNAAFEKYQVRLGGRFPREDYEELVECCQRLSQWFTLIANTSRIFHHSSDQPPTRWQQDFRALVAQTKLTSHEVTSLLALLSSSLSHGQPLPPYVHLPPPFGLAKQMDELDADILSIRHIVEPEYSAFAVLQAVTQYISADIAKVKKHVTTLVGEIDFSFHAVKPNNGNTSDNTSSDSPQLQGKEE